MTIFFSCLFFFIPILLILFLLYIIIYKRNSISKKDILILLMGITILAIYYFPNSNVLEEYDIDSIKGTVVSYYGNNKENFEFTIEDKKNVEKMINIINSFKFYKSPYKTINNVNVSSKDTSISLYMHDNRKSKFIYLLVVNNNSNLNLLMVDNQLYNIMNGDNLTKRITKQLRILGFINHN